MHTFVLGRLLFFRAYKNLLENLNTVNTKSVETNVWENKFKKYAYAIKYKGVKPLF